jgi:hypothetical protein
MRRNTVRPFQKATKPHILVQSEVLHADPVFDATQHGTEHEHDNVTERVKFVLGLSARVFQRSKIRARIR